MAQATLTIDLAALCGNWRRLAQKSTAQTAAVVKADAYGLGLQPVAQALAQAGAKTFFVALAEEGTILRKILGPGPEIFVFSGHMAGDAERLRAGNLVPLLNSVDQMLRHFETLPGQDFGVQLDTGMNRLGMEPPEWAGVRTIALPADPRLVMSHLACADAPDHMMNRFQLETFKQMTGGINAPRSLSATGGILMGPDFHFDVVRPGIGMYGGAPYADAAPVVSLDIPVVQVRELEAGESVGYSNTWVARRPSRIATIGAGYADGIIRAMGPKAFVYANGTRCPIVGRISMDLIGVDVTSLETVPESVELLGPHQTIETLATAAGTIGYEILTSLGARYHRRYAGV